MSDATPFRILSIDGGGIKGVFAASVLAALDKDFAPHGIGQCFDLVCGTSTGGLIAIALGLQVAPAEILQFYEQHGPTIFPQLGVTGQVSGALRQIFLRAKHDPRVLRDAVSQVVQRKQLGHSVLRLLIPSYDAVAGKTRIFRTAHHRDWSHDYTLPALEVALATSAAPTYFPAHVTPRGNRYLDGGVWANCPALLGVLEAVSILGVDLKRVHLLSIGTTSTPFSVSEKRARSGIVGWNAQLIELLMQAQAEGTLAQVERMLPNRFVRVDAITTPGRFSLDGSKRIRELRSLGEAKAQEVGSAVRQRFLVTQTRKFQPVYVLSPDSR